MSLQEMTSTTTISVPERSGNIHACAVKNMTCHVFPSKLNCTGVGVGYCGSKCFVLNFPILFLFTKNCYQEDDFQIWLLSSTVFKLFQVMPLFLQ
jgi:hypothetical protein